jgi:hypothetical protein
MKKLFLTLLLATLCATGYGQTIKSLGYNTTNNRVVGPTNTNALVFTNVTSFDADAFFSGGDIRIGSGALYFGGTERINIEETRFAGEWTFDQPASWRTNLGLGATWLTNDNVTNFRTDIGLGATNDVTFQNVSIESGALYISQSTNQYFYAGDDLVESYVPVIILHPNGLSFSGTNAATAAAATRTNLGLPLAALTNTNNANFRQAIGLEETNGPSVFAATVLWDIAQDVEGVRVDDGDIRVNASIIQTNAPTNTTNAVRWITVFEGTNTYRLPLFQ